MGRYGKVLRAFVYLFCIMLLSGCGNGAEGGGEREGYIAIRIEEEELMSLGVGDLDWEMKNQILCRQFYQGEKVLFLAERDDEGNADIYLYRENGEKEPLLMGAPREYRGHWYMGDRGVCYMPSGDGVAVLKDGEVSRLKAGAPVTDVCELEDGSVILLMEGSEKGMELAELDTRTGEVSKWAWAELDDSPNQSISAGEKGLLLMDKEGVWAVRKPKAGEEGDGRECLMPFGTAYGPGINVGDFRVLKDGMVEVLQNAGSLQRLELCSPEQIIVVRTWKIDDWVRECATRFNRENGLYYVVLEGGDADVGDPQEWEKRQAFQDKTVIGISTGTGADIILSDSVYTCVGDLISGGAFEDLSPYMEASGVREEEYFPAAFHTWRDGDKVYGANVAARMVGLWMDKEFLGGRSPSIYTVVEALGLYEEERISFAGPWNSGLILSYLLEGSEDLWGMVDWEEGACDFSQELFAGILRASKMYSRYRTEDVPQLAGRIDFIDDIYKYTSQMDKLAGEGKAAVGYLFDDGAHMAAQWEGSVIMAISATAPNKEGAWEFIRYMLSVEAQGKYYSGKLRHSGYPMNKEAFDKCAEELIERGAVVVYPNGGRFYRGGGMSEYKELGEEAYRKLYDPTEERMAALKAQLEDMRSFPTRTAPILSIISEEAGAYFSGDKELEDVVGMIENRVQLYLDEHY